MDAQKLLELDARHLWHPYTQAKLAGPPLPIARASGAKLFTAEGAALVDAVSSWWVTLHGHAEPSIAEAVAEQARSLEQVIFAGCTHEPAVRLASELIGIAPGKKLSRVFYSDDGSTAVEVALKMALQSFQNRGQGRKVLCAFDNAYHGDTFGAMSVSGRGVFTDPFGELLFEVARLPDPSVGDAVAAFEQLLSSRKDVAALIVEPLLLAAGGMRMYSEATLSGLARLCTEHGVLLIADEVATGFGRTGPRFACQRAGVEPDLVCLSKGVTGGFMPLGVTLASEELYRAFLSDDRRQTFFHGHSFTGSPLACAAALASMRLFKDPSCDERRARIEAHHRKALERLKASAHVVNARVLGTIGAFDLDVGKGYLSPVGQELAAHALKRGVFLRPLGNVVYVMPPYCVTLEELGQVWGAIAEFVEQLG